MEKYGVLEIAADYCNKGKLEVWIQLFLRNVGHNIALAEGLLKEKRFYIGIILFELSLLNNITAGFETTQRNGGNKLFLGNEVSDLHLVYTF